MTPAWWSKVSGAWVKTRVLALAALVPLFWFASLRSRAWRARGVMWLCAAAGLFFVVYVGGDWMKAHRWFNLFSVALVGTAAVALTEVVWMISGPAGAGVPRLTPRHLLKSRAAYATLALGLGAGAWGVNEARLSAQFFGNPETSVRDIHRRVMYMKGVQERLDLDHVTLLDVDMGAHMFYTDWAIVDIAGLVDVPMARHSDFNKRFLREYLFEERRPDFAHVHGGWARASRIPKIEKFPDRYIEIPGYPIGTRKLHIGNHINKNIFVSTDDQRPPLADFEGGISLVSVDIPAPLVQPGARVFVDTAWRAPLRKAGFRILVALTAADGTRAVSSFAPGYGWYDPKEWKRSETVTTKLRVTVPKTFPEGEASVSFALLDESSGKALGVVTEGSTVHPWMSGAYDGRTRRGWRCRHRRGGGESDRLAALELAEAAPVRRRGCPGRTPSGIGRSARTTEIPTTVPCARRSRAATLAERKVSMTILLARRRSSPDCGGIMTHRRSWPWRVRSRRPWSLGGTRCGPLRISRRPIKPSRPASNSIRGAHGRGERRRTCEISDSRSRVRGARRRAAAADQCTAGPR